MTTGNDNHNGSFIEYVTVMIGGQLFGLPISKVQDVFMLDRLARVPLASAEIAGVLNLRGRIVTAIDMHCRLGLGQRQTDRAAMAVGIEYPRRILRPADRFGRRGAQARRERP